MNGWQSEIERLDKLRNELTRWNTVHSSLMMMCRGYSVRDVYDQISSDMYELSLRTDGPPSNWSA